ncbi:hypothetical protein CPter91_4665 [Collimonas pratensis]|uniref:Uncharacterized protein n=1 Tax=Collimonas pratensis TaxID=279113 RepID=A0A127QAB6_9BURK|nr:hypothetical protein CPter91_4665 [Collimonas pratensis]
MAAKCIFLGFCIPFFSQRGDSMHADGLPRAHIAHQHIATQFVF